MSINIVRNVEVDNNIDGNKTIKKLPFHTKPTAGATDYPTSAAKAAFIQLRKAFTKALILYYFNLKSYIQIGTNRSGYAIGRVLNLLTLDNLGQWHQIAYFSRKMILAKT